MNACNRGRLGLGLGGKARDGYMDGGKARDRG